MKSTVFFKDKIRLFFTPIIFGVLSLSVILFVAIPRLEQLKTDRRVLFEARKAANILQTKLAALQALDESSQSVTLETALAALPLEDPFRQSLLNLDALLARHQIGASQIKVESSAENLSIKFMGLGPISSLQNFISDAGKILPISAVSSIEVSRIRDSAPTSVSASVYNTNIIVKIFFKPPPQTIGRASDPLPILTADHLKTLNLLSQFEQIAPASTDDLKLDLTAAPRLFPE